ncbi:MAG: hypothetical protein GBQ79_12650 [Halomonas sp.]|nr:hypothetical protein [Halomonas sp.]
MKRLLANISVKTSLTFTLAIFALLIMTIAVLGHLAGNKGGHSLEAMDELSMHQMLPLARTQRSDLTQHWWTPI